MEGYGATLGLAKEVPLDDFYKGVQLKELAEQKKVAEAAKKQKYQEELFKMVDRKKVDLLPVFQKDYYKEIDPAFSELVYKQNNGTITPQDVQKFNAISTKADEVYSAKNTVAKDFRAKSAKELIPEGIELQQAFLSDADAWSVLKPKLIEKYKNHPAGLVTPDGDFNLAAFIVTSQDPIGDLGKLNTSSHQLWQQQNNSVFGGKEIVSGRGALKTNAERDKQYANLTPEQRATMPTFESLLEPNLNNVEFIRNVRANHPKEFGQAVNEELMAIASKVATSKGLSVGTPEYNKEVAAVFPQIQKDYLSNPDNEIGIQQKAVKKVAIEKYQPPQTIESKYIQPKATTKGGGSGSGSKEGKGIDLHDSIQTKVTKGAAAINKIIDNSPEPAVALGKALGVPTKSFGDNDEIIYTIPLDNTLKKAYKDYTAPITGDLTLYRRSDGKKVRLIDVLSPTDYNILLNSLGGELDANINGEQVFAMTKSGERIYGKDVKKGKAILKNADLMNQRLFVIDANRIAKKFPKESEKNGGAPIWPPRLKGIIETLQGYKISELKNYRTDDVSSLDAKDQTKEYKLEAGDEIPTGEDNGYVEVPTRPKR